MSKEGTRGRPNERDMEAKRRATAIPWDDSMAGLMDDDQYYEEPGDYFDYHWQSSSEDVPNPDDLCYEYEAEEMDFQIDAKSMLESAWEQMESPADYEMPATDEEVAELQALIDGWVGRLNSNPKWYTTGRYVNLTEVRKAWCEQVKRENEDAS